MSHSDNFYNFRHISIYFLTIYFEIREEVDLPEIDQNKLKTYFNGSLRIRRSIDNVSFLNTCSILQYHSVKI